MLAILSISINLLALTHTFANESHIFTSFHFCHSSLSSVTRYASKNRLEGTDRSKPTIMEGHNTGHPGQNFTQMSFEFSLPLVKQEGVYAMPCWLAQLARLGLPASPRPTFCDRFASIITPIISHVIATGRWGSASLSLSLTPLSFSLSVSKRQCGCRDWLWLVS